MSPDRSPTFCEHRPERHERASTVLHPNGGQVCSYDAAFNAAATSAVLEMHGWKGRQ